MNNTDLNNRKNFENNTDILEYSRNAFGEHFEIRYCNFGFVAIPREGRFVYKYYLSSGVEDTSFAKSEEENYMLFKNHGLLIPTYELLGGIIIGTEHFIQAKIHNIRTIQKRFESFQNFDIQKLATLLARMHSIRPGAIHGNIHPSNFFVDANGEIGVFDLTTYGAGPREKDISRIFINAGYDEDFLKRFCTFYKLEISLKKVYLMALIELRELMHAGHATGFEGMMKKLATLIQS